MSVEMSVLDQARVASAARAARKNKRKKSWTPQRIAVFGLLVVTTAVFLFPIYWAVSTSLQSTAEQQTLPVVWWPSHLQWHNFQVAWTTEKFTGMLVRSIIIVVTTVIGSVASSSLVAFGLARLRFTGRDFWFNVVLSTLMLPFIVTMIPLYLIFLQIGWINTLYPLIIPAFFGGGPFNIFLLRQFMLSLPNDLDEAAKIDGASSFQTYLHIIMPNVKPALAVVAWSTAIASWGDFLGPLVYLSSPSNWTLGLGLYNFPVSQPPGWGNQLIMGIALIVMLPVVIGFFFMQRYLIEGVNLTGVQR